MLTGQDDVSLAVEALASGASDFLVKEADGYFLELLPATIGKVLERDRHLKEKKLAEKTLRESEERYRELCDNMGTCVAIYQAVDDGGDFVFTDFNRAGERADKITKAELVGRRVTEAFPAIKEFGLFEVFQRVWKTGDPEHFPITLYEDERISGWRENYVYKLGTGEIVAVYDDITDRKRAEEELRKAHDELENRVEQRTHQLTFEIERRKQAALTLSESEERYRSIVETLGETGLGIFIVDEDYTVRYMNKVAIDWLGDQTGKVCYATSADADGPCPHCKMEEVISDGVTVRYQSEASGRILDIAATSITNSDGTVSKMEIINDITDRKKAEEALKTAHEELEQRVRQRTVELQEAHDELDMRVARRTRELRESEGKFRLMAENIPSVFWIFTPAMDETVYVSPAYEAVWGQSCESLYESPKSFMDPIHPDDLESVRANFNAREGDIWDMEYRIIMPHGSVRWIHDSGVKVFDAERNASLMAGIATDVTERMGTEEKIRELAKFPEMNPGPVMRFSRDGTLVYANEASQCLLSFFKCDVSGKLEKPWLDAFRETVDSEGSKEIDCTCDESGCDDRSRSYSVLIKHIPETDSIYLYGRDITERKLAEMALRKAHEELEQRVEQRTAELRIAKEEAEQANKAKTGFLAAASHDLRQPMQALNLFVSVLSGREHDEKSGEIIHMIERSTNALDELLNALLDISRLEAGIVVANTTDFSIGGLLGKLADEFRSLAADKGLEFRLRSSHVVIHSDPTLLEQILRNLLSNAIRYTKQGKILCGCRRRGANLRIEIWDTGIGISDDQLKPIFQEFHQAEGKAHAQRKGRGLGLGLSIVDRLAGLLEHPIYVNSVPDKGSVFAVEVPMRDTPAVMPKSAMPKPDKAVPLRNMGDNFFVVIDDDGDILNGMKMLFDEWGCEVLTASSCREALDGLGKRGRLPDLIIADFRLARRQSGIKAINTIKKKLKADIPGILITGDTAPERLQAAKKSGFTLLHKPIRPNVLHQAMIKALGEGTDKAK